MSENTEAYKAAHAVKRAVANQQVRSSLQLRADIPYGSREREKIDFFPAALPGAPLFAFFHPGYWRSRSRDEFSYLAPAFVERGINFASIGYPLCPEVRLREVVASARQAVAFLAREAGSLGFDGTRFHIGGHSAGGHLTAMMVATDWSSFGLPKNLVKSSIGISGLYDLAPVAQHEVNKQVRLDASEIADFSPVTMAPLSDGPVVLTIGGLETEDFRRQMTALATAWKATGKSVTIVETPALHHFDVVDTLGRPGSPIFEAAMATIAV